jgi:hypothetical protein
VSLADSHSGHTANDESVDEILTRVIIGINYAALLHSYYDKQGLCLDVPIPQAILHLIARHCTHKTSDNFML